MFDKTKTPKNLNELKQEIARLFSHYVRWRKLDVVCNLFRDKGLLDKKLTFAEETISYMNHFEGTKHELRAWLDERVKQHADLSRKSGKNHYNLEDGNSSKWVNGVFGEWFQCRQKPITDGQLKNASDMAGMLHKAVQLVQSAPESLFQHDNYKPTVRFLV